MKPTGQRSQNCWDLNAEFMENPGNVTSPLASVFLFCQNY